MIYIESVIIDEANYFAALDSDMGWCTKCQKFLGEMIEPDAENYPCPICKTNSVYGAKQALFIGFITFLED